MTRWYEVVGGGAQGGILVRAEESLASDAASERLATGAAVVELEVRGERIRYKKVSGNGPTEGWVSRAVKGSQLLTESSPEHDGVKMLSHSECVEAQRMLKEALSKQSVQIAVAENHHKYGHDQKKYMRSLTPLLMTQVYPNAVKHCYGPSVDVLAGIGRLQQSFGFHTSVDVHTGNVSIAQAWLEIETLMRNQDSMDTATAVVQQVERSRAGSSHSQSAAVGESSKPDTTELASRDGCEVFNARGDIVGVEFRGRVRGGCMASGCKCFATDGGYSRACSHCSIPNFDHDDMGPSQFCEEHRIIVRIRGLKVPKDSLEVLHVELSEDATIKHLREALGSLIPASASFFQSASMFLDDPLPDDAAVSGEVLVSEVLLPISGDIALVKAQAQEAQEMIIETLRTSAVQQDLEEMETASAGKDAQYRKKLQGYLISKLYPSIASHFGLSPADSARHMVLAISHHAQSDLNMLETWVMIEKLMRNAALVSRAESTLDAFLASIGGNPQEGRMA